jgi:hypothetical protein
VTGLFSAGSKYSLDMVTHSVFLLCTLMLVTAQAGSPEKKLESCVNDAAAKASSSCSAPFVCQLPPGELQFSQTVAISHAFPMGCPLIIRGSDIQPRSRVTGFVPVLNTTAWKPHCLNSTGGFEPCTTSPIVGATVEMPPRFLDFRQLVLSSAPEAQQLHEARWPNLNMSAQFPMLSYSGAWRNVSNASVPGAIVSDELAATNSNQSVVNWTGGTLTAVFKTQYTFTRPIVGYEKMTGTIKYAPIPQGPGEGHRLWGRFWLSGVAAALDSPGEWFFVPDSTSTPGSTSTPTSSASAQAVNRTRGKLYYYPLQSAADFGPQMGGQDDGSFDDGSFVPPVLLAKGLDYAITSDCTVHNGTKTNAANVRLENFDLAGVTVGMHKCDSCSASNINLEFPSFSPLIPEMGEMKGGKATYTAFDGNNISIRNVSIRHTPEMGLFVQGKGVVIDNVLIEDQVKQSLWVEAAAPITRPAPHQSLSYSTYRSVLHPRDGMVLCSILHCGCMGWNRSSLM